MLSILRFKFGLTLRETEGFARSIFEWMGLCLKVPDYSTLCRRLGSLGLILWQDIKSNDRIPVVVNATGLKVYGEGEWKVRIHGVGKRRTWRKLHHSENVAPSLCSKAVLDCMRPVLHFLQFCHFTLKISLLTLSISDTCKHSARRYACPQTLDLPGLQRVGVFCPLTF